MSNAIKYGKRGGHVWVAAKPAGSTVILTVSDDGIGMDKKNLSKVFNRFFVRTGGVTPEEAQVWDYRSQNGLQSSMGALSA